MKYRRVMHHLHNVWSYFKQFDLLFENAITWVSIERSDVLYVGLGPLGGFRLMIIFPFWVKTVTTLLKNKLFFSNWFFCSIDSV